MVDLKLLFYGLILLFDTANYVMQNLIQKSKQNSIAFTKPGLPENLKNFDELQLLYSSIFFAENLHTFPNYQFLQKRVLDFLCFV